MLTPIKNTRYLDGMYKRSVSSNILEILSFLNAFKITQEIIHETTSANIIVLGSSSNTSIFCFYYGINYPMRCTKIFRLK